MPKVLLVCKDNGSFNVLRQPALLLREQGVEVVIAAEGASMVRWKADGWSIYGGEPSAEMYDAKKGIRRDLVPEQVFDSVQPDLVVAGQSAPDINLERTLCAEANRRGIRVVLISDIWGAAARSQGLVQPRIVCVLDPVDAFLAERAYPCAKVVKTGSPNFDLFASTVVPRCHDLVCLTHGFKDVIYVMGQNECTTPFLQGVLNVLGGFSNTLVVMGLHPNFLIQPEFCAPWLKAIKTSKVPVIWVTGLATQYQYMKYATVVVSCFSTGLVEAAIMGKATVSWNSDAGRMCMSRALAGLTQFPTVNSGVTTEVNSEAEFAAFLSGDFRSQSSARTQALRDSLQVDGKAAERIVREVLSLLL